jgi:CDP-paratose 2-epimerase
MKRVLVTGSSGLIGSEAATSLDRRGWEVHSVDNNMRRDFFGLDGDTAWNLEQLRRTTTHFHHYGLDVRDREGLLDLCRRQRPDLIVHCAAQPPTTSPRNGRSTISRSRRPRRSPASRPSSEQVRGDMALG